MLPWMFSSARRLSQWRSLAFCTPLISSPSTAQPASASIPFGHGMVGTPGQCQGKHLETRVRYRALAGNVPYVGQVTTLRPRYVVLGERWAATVPQRRWPRHRPARVALLPPRPTAAHPQRTEIETASRVES